MQLSRPLIRKSLIFLAGIVNPTLLFCFQSNLTNRELRYRRVFRRNQCKFLVSSFLFLFFSQVFPFFFLSFIQVPVCATSVTTFWPSLFFICSISVFFLMPLFILIALYSVIAKHLMINPSLISGQGNRSNFIKYRKQVILMLAAVVISFFTCLLPFRAFTLWIILVPTETIMSLLSSERGKIIFLEGS